jgi:hypothetical protein
VRIVATRRDGSTEEHTLDPRMSVLVLRTRGPTGRFDDFTEAKFTVSELDRLDFDGHPEPVPPPAPLPSEVRELDMWADLRKFPDSGLGRPLPPPVKLAVAVTGQEEPQPAAAAEERTPQRTPAARKKRNAARTHGGWAED